MVYSLSLLTFLIKSKTNKMKTKIINTINEWAPEAVSLVSNLESTNENLADYELLQKLAEVCKQKINSGLENDLEQVREITKVLNILYQGEKQYTKNAIENEFLTVLSFEESPGSLKKHLDLFPDELRKGYIKTIIEN